MNERYTFIDLFEKEVDLDTDKKVIIDKIIIPKIQRPYAQGRKDSVSTYVRNSILNDLFDALVKDNLYELNFIYGVIRPSNDKYVMELLDGQQRLTTLFLLHWYLANRELKDGDDIDDKIRDSLSNFIYETRSSATVFCQKLAGFRKDLSDNTPQEVIKKAKWYFKSFNRDSTIVSMLTMLDAIHNKYNEVKTKGLVYQLPNLQFYVKSLGLYNLSEELYIKMNARGLQLTPFENFKADLTNFVSNHKAFDYSVPLYKKNSDDKIPFHYNFSIKLDAKWVDIFWRKGSEEFDTSYMSFFTRFFASKYIISTKKSVSDREMRSDVNIKKLYTDAENRSEVNGYLGFQVFEDLLKEHPEYVEDLDVVFDLFYEYHESDIKYYLIPEWEKSESKQGDDFYCNLGTTMTQIKLIVFAAVIECFSVYKSFDKTVFKQWMRVVWNVIENTNIDSLTPVSSLIRKFSALLHHTKLYHDRGVNFYKALSLWLEDNQDEQEIRAIIEEVEKAKRIAEDFAWEELFIEAESHPYFKGMVTFFYTKEMSIEGYRKRLRGAKEMFDINGISSIYREKHLLIRAVVSQFLSWGELRETYITENAETQKYLKNILASDHEVRNMFADILDIPDEFSIKNKLEEYISKAEEVEPWLNATEDDKKALKLAVNRLRNDVKMYDWIAAQEKDDGKVFRVYWFYGHIMFAIPRKQYARIAIDTDRADVAYHIHKKHGFEYSDNNQLDMYKEHNITFGNEIWLFQERRNCKVWIGFCLHRELCLQIECNTEEMALDLKNKFENSFQNEEYKNKLILESDKHLLKTETIGRLEQRLDEIFKVIPEVDSLFLKEEFE